MIRHEMRKNDLMADDVLIPVCRPIVIDVDKDISPWVKTEDGTGADIDTFFRPDEINSPGESHRFYVPWITGKFDSPPNICSIRI